MSQSFGHTRSLYTQSVICLPHLEHWGLRPWREGTQTCLCGLGRQNPKAQFDPKALLASQEMLRVGTPRKRYGPSYRRDSNGQLCPSPHYQSHLDSTEGPKSGIEGSLDLVLEASLARLRKLID